MPYKARIISTKPNSLIQVEEALKRTEESLKETQELCRVGSWEYDIEKQTISWSAQTYVLYERDPKLGPPSEEEDSRYYSPEQYNDLRDNVTKAIATGQIISYDLEVRLPSRKRSYYHTTVHPLKNDQGQVIKLFGAVQDITESKQTEEKFKEGEEKYRNLVEVTSDFIWEVNKEGFYTYVSPKIRDILGYLPEEVLGKTPFDLMPPEEAKRVNKEFQEYISQKKPFNSLENINCHKDGHLVVLETSGIPFYGATGKVLGYRGIDRDITERKEAEEALNESEERFSQAFHSSATAFTITSIKDGLIIDVNETYQRLTGYSREELIGHKTTEMGLWLDLRQREELIHRLKAKGKVQNQEVAVRTKHGKVVNTLYSIEIIHLHGQDFALATAIDITARKKAAESLAKAKDELEIKVEERTRELGESEQKYRNVVENANELIVVFQDVIKFINQKGLEITGYSRKELLSRPFTDFIYPDDRAMMAEKGQRRALGEPVPHRYEFRIIHKEGSIKWLLVNAVLIQWEGKPATLGLMSDITEHKLAQEALRVSEEQYRSLVDNASEVIAVVQDGLIKFVSRQGFKATGYSPEEMAGKSFLELVYAGDRKAMAELYQKLSATQATASNYDFRINAKDGGILWILMNTANITWEGRPAVLAICTDISELKQIEEEKEKVSNFNEILTQISSRFINTPIDKLPTEIKDAQRIICEFFEFDLSTVYELQRTATTTLAITSLYTRKEIPPLKKEHTAQKLFPWCERQVFSGNFVKVESMQELPVEAEVDHKTWDFYGIKSSLIFPLITNSQIMGSFSIDSLGKERQFSKDFIAQMQLAAQIFANALARKQTEEALRESEAKANALIKYAPTGIYQLDIRGPRIVSVNDVMSVVSGYTCEELLTMNPHQLLDESSRIQFDERIKRMLTGEKVEETVDYKARRKDGSLIDVTLQISFSKKDPNILLVIAHDITERKRGEESLRASEEKYRSVVENASEAIAITQDGILKYFNPRLLDATGYSAKEVKSKSFLDLIYPDDRKLVAERYQKRIKGEVVPTSYEYRVVRKDGNTRWMLMNAASITWEGRPATLNIFTDITEEKILRDRITEYSHRITQVQEEERKRIAYELHDDTAQYLSILKMQLGALSQSGSIQDPRVKEKLQFLEKDADRAFQDVRRYSHELRPVVLERSGLNAALEQLVDDYNKLGQLTVKMKVGGEETELKEEVKLGFFRIAQEALNNIRKHAKATQANIILTFRENQLEMVVSDNGIGFDIGEASARVGGKGNLGLMSMKERADLIGAKLMIESKPGQGTVVKVARPLDI